MTEEERTERAVRAKLLLDNPLLTEAFDLVRGGIMQRWEIAPLRDKEGAHELKLMLKLLGDLRAALEGAVNDGKVVQFNQKHRLLDGARRVFNI